MNGNEKYILGLNLSHDGSASLSRGFDLIAATEEERLSGIRHDPNLKVSTGRGNIKQIPRLALNACLKQAGLSFSDIDTVVLSDCDLILDVDTLKLDLGLSPKQSLLILGPEFHHLLHAYNSYFLSEFERGLIVVADAFVDHRKNGHRVSESIFRARGSEIYPVKQRICPPGHVSLGAFYQLFCAVLGFDRPLIGLDGYNYWNIGIDESGKLMGLAAHGQALDFDFGPSENGFSLPKIYEFLRELELVEPIDDPESLSTLTVDTYQRVVRPRPMLTDRRDRLSKDLAATAQKNFEREMISLVASAARDSEEQNVCLSGGLALNCLANGKIMRELPQLNIFVPYAPADNGNSIGACFFAANRADDTKPQIKTKHPFLGGQARENSFDGQAFVAALNERGVNLEGPFRGGLIERISEFLTRGAVGMILSGRSEFGPRALGNRSIVADPRSPWMKLHINHAIKDREWFRPLAPVTLTEFASELFESPNGPSPFMAHASILRESSKTMAAVASADGSARYQTVSESESPLLGGLIREFGKKTGTYALLNTSANFGGSPIFENYKTVAKFLPGAPLDFIVIEDEYFLIERDLFDRFATAIQQRNLTNSELNEIALRLLALRSPVRAVELVEKCSRDWQTSPELLQLYRKCRLFFDSPDDFRPHELEHDPLLAFAKLVISDETPSRITSHRELTDSDKELILRLILRRDFSRRFFNLKTQKKRLVREWLRSYWGPIWQILENVEFHHVF